MKVGQKVVCISDKPKSYRGYHPLVVGNIYMVTAVGCFCKCGITTVYVGIDAPVNPCPVTCRCGKKYIDHFGEWPFPADAFAPLEERGDVMIDDILKPIEQVKFIVGDN